MFVAVQIPLADLRYFVGEPKARLSVPAWPLADPTKNFIRGVGSVRERRLGGVPEWIGESLYCDARHALVFPPDRGTVVHEGSPIAHLTPLYRRFVAFGQAQWGGAVARMDVGFKVRGRYTTGKPTGRILPIPEVAALAAATVKLKLPPDDRLRTLLTSGDAIADKLRTVTTSLVDPPASVNRWWVRAGIPLVLIEAPFTERFIASLDPPTELGIASPEAHDSLALQHFSHVEYQGQRAPVWTLFYSSNIPTEQLRQLRIHLWRLHNEREVLRLVLNACLQKQVEPAQPALRDYLARQSASLRRAKRHGLPQADLLSQAYALDARENASEISLLSQILSDVNRGMAKSVVLMSTSTESASPPAPAVYINKDTIEVVPGPGMAERYLIPVGRNLMALGPIGIVTYLASSALVHAPPIWPYFVFVGIILLGGLLYFLPQKRPEFDEYSEQTRVIKGRTEQPRKIRRQLDLARFNPAAQQRKLTAPESTDSPSQGLPKQTD